MEVKGTTSFTLYSIPPGDLTQGLDARGHPR